MATAQEGWSAVDRVIVLLEQIAQPHLQHDLVGNLVRARAAAANDLRSIEGYALMLADACDKLRIILEERDNA